jgi:hypothetical protein
MPESRRNMEIDNVFNQFLTNLNPTEKSLDSSNSRVKTLTNEKALFKLLNDGWELIKAADDVFTIRKTMNKLRG